MARKSFNKQGVFGGVRHGQSDYHHSNYSVSNEYLVKNKRSGFQKLTLIEKHLDNLTPQDIFWFNSMKTAYKQQHSQLKPKQHKVLNDILKKCNSTIYQKPLPKIDFQKLRKLVGIKAP